MGEKTGQISYRDSPLIVHFVLPKKLNELHEQEYLF